MCLINIYVRYAADRAMWMAVGEQISLEGVFFLGEQSHLPKCGIINGSKY
jgi:hypothetical protein